jgi:hypothetical protein
MSTSTNSHAGAAPINSGTATNAEQSKPKFPGWKHIVATQHQYWILTDVLESLDGSHCFPFNPKANSKAVSVCWENAAQKFYDVKMAPHFKMLLKKSVQRSSIFKRQKILDGLLTALNEWFSNEVNSSRVSAHVDIRQLWNVLKTYHAAEEKHKEDKATKKATNDRQGQAMNQAEQIIGLQPPGYNAHHGSVLSNSQQRQHVGDPMAAALDLLRQAQQNHDDSRAATTTVTNATSVAAVGEEETGPRRTAPAAISTSQGGVRAITPTPTTPAQASAVSVPISVVTTPAQASAVSVPISVVPGQYKSRAISRREYKDRVKNAGDDPVLAHEGGGGGDAVDKAIIGMMESLSNSQKRKENDSTPEATKQRKKRHKSFQVELDEVDLAIDACKGVMKLFLELDDTVSSGIEKRKLVQLVMKKSEITTRMSDA